jgi:predicted butyrate kinase (DUF1464 family)
VAPDLNADERKKVMEAHGKLYRAKYLRTVKAFTGVREAACGAGTAAAGLLSGGFTKEALTEAGCFVVVSELRDLLACFENGPSRMALAAGG